jgi:formylglycine-generating enzyme required for sulfatase activity
VPAPDGGEWREGVNWQSNCAEGDDLPVTCVSWEDAVAFCNWLSKAEGRKPCYERSGEQWIWHPKHDGYRLPTEAEWEYMARGGSKDLLPLAPAALPDLGWFDSNAKGKPHAVGTRAPNARGLHDVWGNVWEWCWDWYTKRPTAVNGPASGTERAVWGGGWNDASEQVARQPRKGLPPTHRSTDVGFRVVRTILSP